MGKKKHKKKGWHSQHPLHRDSRHKPEVKRGFFIITLCVVLLLGGFAGAGVAAYHWLCRSDFLQITAVDVAGNRDRTKEEIIRLSGIDVHANLLAIDPDAAEARILQDGWIEKAEVQRMWPSRILIEVRERRAVALLNTRKGLYYLDANGDPFAPRVGQDEMDLPAITGLEDAVTFEGRRARSEAGKELADVLQFIACATRGSSSLPAQNISEVSFGKDREVVLFLADRPFPIFLGREVGKKSYNRLAKVLYWLYKKKEFQTVAYIRLDYMEDKVLVGTELAKGRG